MPSFSFDTREPKHLWLAQTAETLMTTMCPWILALRHSVLPRLTVLRISTSLWARGPITLTSQDSLQHYLPVRVAVPPCVTGPAVLVMSPHHPSTATSNLTGNVSFWQQRFHWSTFKASSLFICFTNNSSAVIIMYCWWFVWRQCILLTLSGLAFHSEANTSWFEEQ